MFLCHNLNSCWAFVRETFYSTWENHRSHTANHHPNFLSPKLPRLFCAISLYDVFDFKQLKIQLLFSLPCRARVQGQSCSWTWDQAFLESFFKSSFDTSLLHKDTRQTSSHFSNMMTAFFFNPSEEKYDWHHMRESLVCASPMCDSSSI